MATLKDKWNIVCAQISLKEPVPNILRQIILLIAVLQVVSTISSPSTNLYLLTQWSDPSSFLPPSLIVIIGTFYSLLIVVIMLSKLGTCHQQIIPTSPSLLTQYFNAGFSYAKAIGQYVFLVPLIKGCLISIINPQNVGLQITSVITLVLFICLVYPILLYLDGKPPLLLKNSNRALTILNIQIFFNIYRPILALLTFSTPPVMVTFSTLFFALSCVALIKNPIFSLNWLKIENCLISIAIYASLNKLIELISSGQEKNVIIELISIMGFMSLLINCLKWRTKAIVQKEQSVYQIKLIIFMICHLPNYFDVLSEYIITHYKQCKSPICTCSKVIQNFTNKHQDSLKEQIWFQFAANLISHNYQLEDILKLPKTEMETKSEQYSQLIFQQAQITLFQLKKVNKSYILLSDFKSHLSSKNLDQLWDPLRFSVICYHIQRRIQEEKSINVQAKLFSEIQVKIGKFLRYLLQTGEKSELFWKQLASFEPNADNILSLTSAISKNIDKIKDKYKELTHDFPATTNVLDPIFKDFLGDVFSSNNQQELQFWEVTLKGGQEKSMKRLDENMQLFSEDSQTPMFLMSAQNHDFGKISKLNMFFQNLIQHNSLKVEKLEDLILPELQKKYGYLIKEAIQSSKVMMELPEIWFLNSKNDLYSCQLLIQIFPSLEGGLKYAIFLKNISTKRKLLVVSNRVEIIHKSSSLEIFQRVNTFQQIVLNSVKKNKQVPLQDCQITLQEQSWRVKVISSQSLQSGTFDYLELVEQTQSMTQTKLFSRPQQSQKNYGQEISINHRQSSIIKKRTVTLDINNIREEQSEDTEKNKITRTVKKIFSYLNARQRGGNIKKRITCMSLILTVILMGLFCSCIFIKSIDKHQHTQTFRFNRNFTKLMKTLGEVSTNLKLINLNTTAYSYLYQEVINTSSIYQDFQETMAFFAKNSQPGIANPNLTTLSLSSNRTFTPGSLPLYHALPDLIQRPLINLQSTPLNDFKFSFSLDYLTPPLTPTQTYFHTFLTNSIYFVIPYLRTFQFTTLSVFLEEQLSGVQPIIVVCPIIMAVTLAWLFCFVCCHRKIVTLNNFSRRFLQQIKAETMECKMKKCRCFLDKYKLEQTKQINASLKFSRATNLKLTRAIDLPSQTIDSFNSNLVVSDEIPQAEEESGRQIRAARPGRKKDVIFKNSNYTCMVLAYLLCSIPILSIAGAFMAIENKQNSAIQLSSKLLYGSGIIESDYHLIELYALQFGVYNYQLQQYLSIGKYFVQLIYANYYLTQLILQMEQQGVTSKALQTFQQLQYANLCQLEQEGHFDYSDKQFEGRGNYTVCSSISGGVLTRGYMPSLVHYLDQANILFTQNTYTIMYPPSKKMEYLTSQFFTDTARLLNYFDIIMSNSMNVSLSQLDQTLSYIYSIFIICVVVVLFFTLTLFIFLRRHYLSIIQLEVDQISTIFTLISYQTIGENPELNQQFVGKFQDLSNLK